MKKSKVILCIVLIVLMIFCLIMTSCNKAIIDPVYNFDYALIDLGGSIFSIEISKWADYEDGEQIQIWDKDGNVYLTTANNMVLVKGSTNAFSLTK